MMLGGAGIGLGLRGKLNNAVSLPPGGTYIIPAGNYQISLGAYTELQFLDPVTGIWRTQMWPGEMGQFACDGANQRLANLTGCPVAAVDGKQVSYVHVGNYIGQNYGKITKITDEEVELNEIYLDAGGDWAERTQRLELQEAKK